MGKAHSRPSLDIDSLRGVKPGPLPSFIKPCLATLVDEVPAGEAWMHEIKFDGYRIQARIDGENVQLLTRTGLDWTPRFKGVAKALTSLGLGSAVIDGEVVVQDELGLTNFVELVTDLKAGRSDRMVYFAFDLLYLKGMRLVGATLRERKMLLGLALKAAPKTGAVQFSAHLKGKGEDAFAQACKIGLEGIISKREDRPYRSGRHEDWVKTKCIQTDEFVVGGYVPSTAIAKAIGALALGYFRGGRLIYAGRVGTGFSRGTAADLWKTLQPLRREAAPFEARLTTDQRRDAVWVKPVLVAQIAYRGWTGDDLLRHASFKGLREDKPAAQVERPHASSLATAKAAD